MSNQSGFFLVEVLIYILLFSILVIMMLRMNVCSITQLAQSRVMLSRVSSLNLLLHKFEQDVEAAPAESEKWFVIKPDTLVWDTGKEFVGWTLEKETIIRHQGNYDYTKAQWGKKTKSVGAQNIKSLLFNVEKQESAIVAIHIEIEAHLIDKTKKLVSSPRLLSRVLS